MLLLVAGLAFAAAGLIVVVRTRRLSRNGVRTTGVVVGLAPGSSDESGRRIMHPVVSFATVAGEAVTAQASLGSGSGGPRVGATVPVLYDPTRPTRIAIDTFAQRGTWLGWIGLLIGLGLLGTGVAGLS